MGTLIFFFIALVVSVMYWLIIRSLDHNTDRDSADYDKETAPRGVCQQCGAKLTHGRVGCCADCTRRYKHG